MATDNDAMTDVAANDPGSDLRATTLDSQARELADSQWDIWAASGGGLGRLAELGTWISSVQAQCPPHPLRRPVLMIVGADHGIARAKRTSGRDPHETANAMRRIGSGQAAVSAIADVLDVTIRAVDVGIDAEPDYLDDIDPRIARSRIRRVTGAIDSQDAMSLAETSAALALGRRLVDDEIDSGTDLFILGNVGVGATTSASSLVASLASTDPVSVTGRGSGIDDIGWMHKVGAIRDAVHRARDARGDMPTLLARIGGPDIAVLTGMLLQAAARRTPVILDGLVVTSAALVAHRLDFRARHWWMCGHDSGEPAHGIAMDRLDMRPLLNLAMPYEEGIGGLLAVPIVRSAIAVLTQQTPD
jgi:nicotinate-nucleotide--dimethylbenzimidazole phosphoribosyltransferase